MSDARKAGPLASLILGIVFIAIGIVVSFMVGKPILDNAKASTEWPKVEGVVTQSEVTTSRSDGKTMYSAQVLYEYRIGGKKYTADTVSFGGSYSSSSSSEHQKLVNRYPKEKKVEVFCDPAAHENAVLEPGATWKSYIVFGAGLLLLFVGVAMAAIPLFMVGIAIFGLGGGRPKQSPWQADTPAQPWTGGSSETLRSSGHISTATSNRVGLDDDGIDVG